MYCPNCGSNNQPGTKFCARCGMNITVVTEALTGKPTGPNLIDERMIKLIKEYHKGRRDAISGAILIPAGMLIMSIMVAAGLNPIGAFFIICWMFFWGVSALASGVGKWVASSGEMKSLGFASQPAEPPRAVREPLAGQLDQPAGKTSETGYSTGPIDYPGSVTEQTTRQLDLAFGWQTRQAPRLEGHGVGALGGERQVGAQRGVGCRAGSNNQKAATVDRNIEEAWPRPGGRTASPEGWLHGRRVRQSGEWVNGGAPSRPRAWG